MLIASLFLNDFGIVLIDVPATSVISQSIVSLSDNNKSIDKSQADQNGPGVDCVIISPQGVSVNTRDKEVLSSGVVTTR